MNYGAMKLIQAHGAHIGLGIGFLFGALQFLTIAAYSSQDSVWLLLIGALCLAVTNSFVWNAQHSFIAQVVEHSTKSSNLAKIEIVGKLFSIVGPLVGGIIGSLLGTPWLLTSAILVVLSTFAPLRHMRTIAKSQAPQIVRYNLSGAPRNDLVANFCFNVETTVSMMFWPIYLAVVIGNFHSIGIIATVGALAAAGAAWIAGWRGDRQKDRSVLRQGTVMISVVNLMRIFAQTPLTIGVVGALYQSSLAYLQNAWVSTYYHHAKYKGAQYIVSMEIACDAAYVFVWGILLALTLAVPDLRTLFIAAFGIAALAGLGCLLISKQGTLTQD